MCPQNPLNYNAIIRDHNNIEVQAGVDASGRILNALYKPIEGNNPYRLGVQKTISVDEIDCASNTNPIENLKHTRFILVEDSDVGINYVSGSVGQVKEIREFKTGSITGDYAKITTFIYPFENNSCQPSDIIESNGVV